MKDLGQSLALSTLMLAGGFLFIAEALANPHERNVEILRSIPLVKGLEYRSDKEERRITHELKEIFKDIQLKAANSDSTLNRATHAKGGCFEAEFTLLGRSELKSKYGLSDETIEKLKQGIFSQEKSYRAQVRFANAKGEKIPDTQNDARGVGLSIDLGGDYKDWSGESRQDYSANNTPMFPTGNIKEFHELMKVVSCASGNLRFLPNPLYLKSTIKAGKLVRQYERNDTKSYATEEYWGNIASVHGLKADGSPKYVSKFKLVPCDGKGRQSESSEGKADNFLQQEITERAREEGVCFLYQIQIMDLKKLQTTLHSKWSAADFVEYGGELWHESLLPFHTVAKIEVKKGAKKLNCQDAYVNPRLHSNPQNMPIGSISRVRAEVEEASRARRLGNIK